MLDQAIRFGAILAQPEFEKGGSLFEVGSGSRGISAFVSEKVLAVDVDFPEPPAANMTAIRASATHLPLRAHAFDRVISSDMLEHLTAAQRGEAIGELLRVTSGCLFLACPCDAYARRTDERLARIYKNLGITAPEWLRDHLRNIIPDSEAIRSILKEQGANWREITGESAGAHFIVSLLISSKILNRFWSALFTNRADLAKKLGEWGWIRGRKHYRKLWVIRKKSA